MVDVLSRRNAHGFCEVYIRYDDRSELTVVEAFMILDMKFCVAYWRMHGDVVWVLVTINFRAFFLYKCTNGTRRFVRRFLLEDLPAPVNSNHKRQYIDTFGRFDLYKTGRDENGPIFAASPVARIERADIKLKRYGPVLRVNDLVISLPRGNEFELLRGKNIDGCGYLLILAKEYKDYKLIWSAILRYSFLDDEWNEEYVMRWMIAPGQQRENAMTSYWRPYGEQSITSPT